MTLAGEIRALPAARFAALLIGPRRGQAAAIQERFAGWVEDSRARARQRRWIHWLDAWLDFRWEVLR